MATSARSLRQVSSVLLRECGVARPIHRAFTTRVPQITSSQHLLASRKPYWLQTRQFSKSTCRRYAAVQEAPRKESYLESGVIETGKNLVDVKKVLVIGSGGLAIGQAGEFDYSGERDRGKGQGEKKLTRDF